MADKEATIKRAEKRVKKAVEDYRIPEAVEEIGKALQMATEVADAKEADMVASADLPGGDMAMAVFSVVKKEDLDDSDDSEPDSGSDDDDEWAITPAEFKFPQGGTWQTVSEDVDRFRDAVSANYGFERDLVNPLMMSNPMHPLCHCKFECMGVAYEVRKRQISVAGNGDA